MHFRHISAKIQLKNLKQHFDWVCPPPPPGYALDRHKAYRLVQTSGLNENEYATLFDIT